MAAAPGGLTASIRRKLQDGSTPEEIIQELVAGGMGQVSAQRFVDRALAENGPAPQMAPPPVLAETSEAPRQGDALDQFIQVKRAETLAAEEKVGRKALWVTSALMCGGIAITAGSYMAADAGERYTVMWGPVAVGFALWAKTLLGGFSNPRSFAWFSAVASGAAPIVLAMALLGIIAATEPSEEELRQAQLAGIIEKATDDEGAGAQNVASRSSVDASHLDIEGLLAHWDDASELDELDATRLKCDFALQMSAYTGEHRQWLANELAARIEDANDQVKMCNASAILRLDPQIGAGIYQQWRSGANGRLKSAANIAMARSRR